MWVQYVYEYPEQPLILSNRRTTKKKKRFIIISIIPKQFYQNKCHRSVNVRGAAGWTVGVRSGCSSEPPGRAVACIVVVPTSFVLAPFGIGGSLTTSCDGHAVAVWRRVANSARVEHWYQKNFCCPTGTVVTRRLWSRRRGWLRLGEWVWLQLAGPSGMLG